MGMLKYCVGSSGTCKKPGMVLEHNNVTCAGAAALPSSAFSQAPVYRRPAELWPVTNNAGIENDSVNAAFPKAVIVRTEVVAIVRQRFRRRIVSHIMVSRKSVNMNRRIDLRGNAQVLRRLHGISSLIDKIAAITTNSVQAIDAGNGKFVVRRFLGKVAIAGGSAELRIGQLNEKIFGFPGSGRRHPVLRNSRDDGNAQEARAAARSIAARRKGPLLLFSVEVRLHQMHQVHGNGLGGT